MRSAYFAIPAALVIALMPAQAAHCTTPSTSVSDDDTLIVVNPLGFYHVWEMCQPNCLFWYELWEESNGVAGLQRWDDTCHWMVDADTFVY